MTGLPLGLASSTSAPARCVFSCGKLRRGRSLALRRKARNLNVKPALIEDVLLKLSSGAGLHRIALKSPLRP